MQSSSDDEFEPSPPSKYAHYGKRTLEQMMANLPSTMTDATRSAIQLQQRSSGAFEDGAELPKLQFPVDGQPCVYYNCKDTEIFLEAAEYENHLKNRHDVAPEDYVVWMMFEGQERTNFPPVSCAVVGCEARDIPSWEEFKNHCVATHKMSLGQARDAVAQARTGPGSKLSVN